MLLMLFSNDKLCMVEYHEAEVMTTLQILDEEGKLLIDAVGRRPERLRSPRGGGLACNVSW